MKFAFKQTIVTAIIQLIAVYGLALILFSSCTSGRYYARAHDGCQQAQGFAGYGNK